MELNSLIGHDTSDTRTEHLARTLFKASWTYNDGRMVDDVPLYDALSDGAKRVLMDTAAAAEILLDEFGNEEERLVVGNLAWTLFDAYHCHPFCSEPNLPFVSAPADVKALWVQYAKDVLACYYEKKYLPSAPNFMDIQVNRC